LLAGLVTRMRLKNLVAGHLVPHPTGEALQRLDHPALPVDQGAVAVEGECVEIRKQHVDFSSFIGAAKSCRNDYELQLIPSRHLLEREPHTCSWVNYRRVIILGMSC
jgi:hypothetical protein